MMLLNRLEPIDIPKRKKGIIIKQASFRPRKSCTNQVLNLTQNIESGFKSKQVASIAFIGLSAKYMIL